ncbi:Violaxanthin de-epoxidase [Nymphaea thermarum]|nr:Violaxanthin de-epoxidase [Nymphaea thermarum]
METITSVLRNHHYYLPSASITNHYCLPSTSATTLPTIHFRREAACLHLETAFRSPCAQFPTTRAVSQSAHLSPPTTDSLVRIVTVVGDGSVSPLKSTPWEEVMHHTAERLKWVDEGYEMLVFTDRALISDGIDQRNLRRALWHVDILLVVAVTSQNSVSWLHGNTQEIQNVVYLDSSGGLKNKLGGKIMNADAHGSFFGKISNLVKGPEEKESVEILKRVSESWARRNADDIRFCLLVLINSYVRPVPILKNLRAKGFSTLTCMVKNCGTEILNCLLDPSCRKALQCLNSCGPTDQVCSYRCIASYESKTLEAFSLCVLEKHNCLGMTAEISSKPYVPPLSIFRGEQLTHEAAEDIFVGWLGRLDWSWRVIAGQNPAYDQFPCQYQLFYRGKARGSFWYEPVFGVKTLSGEMLWRRRRYRVRRSSIPGTFFFTVLDNGVVSKEFWTIVDVCDDLSWALFHYSGAAQAAGQSYTGAVLVSPDGSYPSKSSSESLASALERCCIKDWELYAVDNRSCEGPPLGIPDGSSLHQTINVNDLKPFLV